MITPPPTGPREPRDYSDWDMNAAPGFNRWDPVDVNTFEVSAQTQLENPLAIFAMVVESSSRQSEVLLHDPLRALTGYAGDAWKWQDDGFVGDPILERGEHRVNTLVLRHERTLEFRITRSLAILDGNGTVTLVAHKQEA